MKHKVTWLLVRLGLAFCLFQTPARAADDKITLPTYGDKYSQMVADLEAGKQDVDFKALREAWLESKASAQMVEAMMLQKELGQEAAAMHIDKVADVARKILSINYTDMLAHKFLRQSCEYMKDKACSEKYHFIEFGLLNSIMKSGNKGTSCADALQVVSVDEEYFIMKTARWKLQKQSLVNEGGKACDKMDVVTDAGQPRTIYFDVTKVLAAEARMLMPH